MVKSVKDALTASGRISYEMWGLKLDSFYDFLQTGTRRISYEMWGLKSCTLVPRKPSTLCRISYEMWGLKSDHAAAVS